MSGMVAIIILSSCVPLYSSLPTINEVIHSYLPTTCLKVGILEPAHTAETCIIYVHVGWDFGVWPNQLINQALMC